MSYMDFDLSPSSPVIEIQANDFANTGQQDLKLPPNAPAPATPKQANVIVIEDSPQSQKDPMTLSDTPPAAVVKEPAAVAAPFVSNGNGTSNTPVFPAAKSTTQPSIAKHVQSKANEVDNKRPLVGFESEASDAKRAKIGIETVSDSTGVKTESLTGENSTLAVSVKKEHSEQEKSCEYVVPEFEAFAEALYDTDDEEIPVLRKRKRPDKDADTSNGKSIMFQHRYRKKPGVTFRVIRHEMYQGLLLVIVETKTLCQYIGVFDDVARATAAGEQAVEKVLNLVDALKEEERTSAAVAGQKSVALKNESFHSRGVPFEVDPFLKILSLGKIVHEGPSWRSYHNTAYLYPAGFKSVRHYYCCITPKEQAKYTSEIMKGPNGPLFRVTHENGSTYFDGDSPNTVWAKVVKAINKRRTSLGISIKAAVPSGALMYGFHVEAVAKLLEQLPNAMDCETYQFSKVKARFRGVRGPVGRPPKKKGDDESKEALIQVAMNKLLQDERPNALLL